MLEEILRDYREKIDKLIAESEKYDMDNQKFREKLEDIHNKYVEAEKRIQEMKNVTGKKWDTLKPQATSAIEKLKLSYTSALNDVIKAREQEDEAVQKSFANKGA
ncbi:MAG: hypothetical protein ACLFQV_13040 [Vulcanimicrobiota bacterium]